MRNKAKKVDQIRAALENGERITSLDAYNRFGAQHLASIIRHLRNEGMAIDTLREFRHRGNGRAVVYARYALACADDGQA